MVTHELFGPDDGGRVYEEDGGRVAKEDEVDGGRWFHILEEDEVERQCYKVKCVSVLKIKNKNKNKNKCVSVRFMF